MHARRCSASVPSLFCFGAGLSYPFTALSICLQWWAGSLPPTFVGFICAPRSVIVILMPLVAPFLLGEEHGENRWPFHPFRAKITYRPEPQTPCAPPPYLYGFGFMIVDRGRYRARSDHRAEPEAITDLFQGLSARLKVAERGAVAAQ